MFEIRTEIRTMNTGLRMWTFLRDDYTCVHIQSSDLFSVFALDCTRTFFLKSEKENSSVV